MTRRLITAILTLTFAAVGVQVVTTLPASATPPGVPTVTTARSELTTLAVAAWTHTTTYNRDLFPTWDIWTLTVTSAEKSALTSMLNTC